MPRVTALRFHVYDGATLTYRGIGYHRPLTADEEAAIPAESPQSRRAHEHEYEIQTWLDGPREGEEGIVFRGGLNWIPAQWPVRRLTARAP